MRKDERVKGCYVYLRLGAGSELGRDGIGNRWCSGNGKEWQGEIEECCKLVLNFS